MDSDRSKQVDSLLQAALERPASHRAEFLRQACAGDESLEREVLSLLVSRQEAGSFTQTAAVEAAQDLAPQSLSGQTISHYRVIEKLGEGGMGVVWKARDTRLDRFVALKVLPPAKMADPDRKRRFVQEAKTVSALNHPNIITIYDIEQADGADFIAMEFVPGQTLGQSIPRKGMALEPALRYAVEIADALAAAHAVGIVHRDLKPGNIMLHENGFVKVLDFGLAKLTEQSGSGEFARTQTMADVPKTDEGVIVGTFSYMSPEQAQGKKVDARADIFSFGAVLYEMLTGHRAFTGDTTVSILSSILRDQPKPAIELVPGLPPRLNRIVTRCLRKEPNERYQHAGDLKIDLQEASGLLGAGESEAPARRPGAPRLWWLVAAAAAVASSFAMGWWLRRPTPAPSAWRLNRLTTDSGLARRPALSPDGKLVAYSSDRSQDGGEDIYVKQVAGGQPIRLTSDGAGNTQPDFSPDGSRIAFRSNRGGIYEIPAFGGEARFLARDGWNPRYSPDGSQVAYWVGSSGVAVGVPGSGSVWVVPAAGGQPQRVSPSFTAARHPIWSPDGKRLLFVGYTSTKAYQPSAIDWWLAAPNGGDAVQTEARDALVRAGLLTRESTAVPLPGCWSAAGNAVIFSTGTGDALDLWELGISPRTGKISAAPVRLTTGAGSAVDPSCASGALAFTSSETSQEVWSLPFDLDRGTPRGSLEQITQGPAARQWVALSNNGRFATYSSNQSGRANIWIRDLANGKESIVSRSSFPQQYALPDGSGSRVAYSVFESPNRRVLYLSTPGGAPEKLCEDCLRATDWSRDEKTLLVFGGNPFQINSFDLASHRQTPLAKHPSYQLIYARFSPDNRWVSFTARLEPSRAHIVIAPLDGPKPIPESAWITIAEAQIEDYANWSPDGKTLYFTSGKDGYTCVWAQRIDAATRKPVGEPFPVQHLHGRVEFTHRGWSAAAGRIALSLDETTGNIWMMSRPKP